jgi:ABC-type dipeptide/oligopeptide/nickel transport system permease subunit
VSVQSPASGPSGLRGWRGRRQVSENLAELAVPGGAASPTRIAFRRMFRNRLSIVGVVLLALIVLLVIFGPLVWSKSPTAQNLNEALASPSATHPLGTDTNGRDALSRLLNGGRVSIGIALVSVLLAATGGMVIGLVAGFRRGIVDGVLMRIMDVFLAFPDLLLAMAVVAVFGPGMVTVGAAVAIANFAFFARLTRSVVISVREREFVLAARSSGVRESRIMTRHVLRNSLAPVIVGMALTFGFALLEVGSLGFLGLGVQAPQAEWGTMLEDGTQYLLSNPIVVLVPGLAIALTALAANLVADALNDALAP